MNVKISNCYYHTDRPAVGVCAQCGAGICRECAVKDDSGRIICYKCGNRNLKQEHREYREMLKQQGGRFRSGKEFIVPGIIGILLVIAVGFAGYYNGVGISVFIVVGYIFFSIPFGVIKFNDIFAPHYSAPGFQSTRVFWMIVFSLSMGWIVFAVYLIRFIVAKIRSR